MKKEKLSKQKTINAFFAYTNHEKQTAKTKEILLKHTIQQLKADTKNVTIQSQ